MGISKNNYYSYFKKLRLTHPEWHDLTNIPEILASSLQSKSNEDGKKPDTEVVLNSRRRKWSLADKARILEETDNASPSELGSILRREGPTRHLIKSISSENGLLDARASGLRSYSGPDIFWGETYAKLFENASTGSDRVDTVP
jgi:hypothetical protein